MKKLIAIAMLLLPIQLWAADSKVTELTATTAPANTDVLYIVTDPSGTPTSKKVTAGNLGQAILIATTTVASLPSPTTGMIRAVTDGTSGTDCITGGGSTVAICWYDGTEWTSIGSSGGAEADTLDTVIGRGNTTDGCTEADPCQFGNGTVYVNIYVNDANQFVIEPSTAADRYLTCMTNQKCGFYDTEGGAVILDIDPDAASTLAMYTFGTAYKPKKTIDFPAASLTTDTAQCASPALATINSGQPRYTIICTDNDASSIYGEVVMPDAWDAGTVTFKHRYVQTAADTSALNGDIAASCRRSGDTINNTWGTEIAIDDAAVSGSSVIDMTTSAAVTPNGTCAGGALLQFRYQLDAGGTTTAVATLHHLGFTMEYSVVSLSD